MGGIFVGVARAASPPVQRVFRRGFHEAYTRNFEPARDPIAAHAAPPEGMSGNDACKSPHHKSVVEGLDISAVARIVVEIVRK